MLMGPLGQVPVMDARAFCQQCERAFGEREHVLSLGWTTGAPAGSCTAYTAEHVDAMLAVLAGTCTCLIV